MAIKKTKKAEVETPPPAPEIEAAKSLVEITAEQRDVSMMQIREEWGIAEDGSEDNLPQVDEATGEIYIGDAEVNVQPPLSTEPGPAVPNTPIGHNGGPPMDSAYKLTESTAELLGGFMERLQYQAQSMKDLKDATKATLAEAKSAGLDPNVLKSAMKQLDMSTEEREKHAKARAEHEQMIDLYVLACEERV